MTVLLLEGPDGAGKSTLAKALVEQHGFSSRHFGLVQSPFEHYLHHLLSLELDGNHVIDRLHPSEYVYGNVCRNNDRLAGVHRLLDRVLLSMGAVMVYCNPGYEIAQANWAARRATELEQDEARYHQIHEAYNQYLHISSLPLVIYNYTHQSVDRILTNATHVAGIINPGPGVGHWHEGVTLIVGERPGAGNGPGLPFVWHKHCSRWLAQQLNIINADEKDLYWINAYNIDGEETSPIFVEHLRPRRVIALGDVAKTWCHRHAISADSVPHPQYWRRFKSGQWYPLLDLLLLDLLKK